MQFREVRSSGLRIFEEDSGEGVGRAKRVSREFRPPAKLIQRTRMRSPRIPLLLCALLSGHALFAGLRADRPALAAFFFQGTDTRSFHLRSPGLAVDFEPGSVTYHLHGGDEPERTIRLVYREARAVVPQGANPLPGKLNDFTGAEASHWRSDISLFSQVIYHEMWPGIDVVYSVSGETLKTEFRLQPGSSASLVRWRVEGADSLTIENGALVAKASSGSIREAAPRVFQVNRITGERKPIAGSFRLLGQHSAGIRVSDYDHRNTLVFDPVIGFSTYLGGSGQSQATAVAVDSSGNSVIAGYTTSQDLAPTATVIGNPLRTTAFIAKVTAAGNQLIFCTYLGGSLDNRAFALALDRWNNIYVAGVTSSSDFPVLKALQRTRRGPQDAFIAELNPLGNGLVFSTYWGGSGVEQANGIAIDRQGEIYVTGDTQSTDFPTVRALQPVSGGGLDGFVVKFGLSGSSVIWSSYLGGTADEHAAAIAVDYASAVDITGSTQSSNFPAVNAFQPHNAGSQNAFVTRINPVGNSFGFSTYLGGSGASPGLPEMGSGVAVDNSGSIYVTGTTASPDFPVTRGAFQTATPGGFLDAFVTKLNPWGGLVYSTYVGGVNADYGQAIAVDAAGNAHLAGYTASPDFPSLRNVQSSLAGAYDLFVTTLNAAGSGLISSTLWGGALNDSAAAIALDRYGTVVVAGQSQSPNFPTASAYQTSLTGVEAAIVLRMPAGWTPVLFSSNGVWSIDALHNGGSNGVTAAVETLASFGHPGDVPIVGDWAGTGHQYIGLFRNGTWFLDMDGDGYYTAADRTFVFGQAGDIPVAGDWDGSGTVKAGLFRNGTFLLDFSGLLSGIPTGKPQVVFPFGQAGDVPVVGDWNSLGSAKVGVFRNGQWLLDTNGSHTINGPARFLGQAGDIPLVGDWDGSGLSKAGVYRNGVFLLDYNGNWNLDAYGDVALPFGPAEKYALTQY